MICGGGYVGRWGSDMWRWVCREVGYIVVCGGGGGVVICGGGISQQ